MSVQNLPPNPETAAEPEDLTIRRLVRAIDYAEGFWLGFAKSNTPAQRRRLSALCKDLLEPLKIRVLEIELTEPITDLLPILRDRLAQERTANAENTQPNAVQEPTSEASTPGRPKLAIFVHGLEHSIPSREAYPPLLSSLNLKRELFRQEVPHPLLLWLPDYALTALARKAPDFWAWRSGLYEFAPERDAANQFLEAISGEETHVTESLLEQAKRERLVMLKGLLEDYRELGYGPREQEARINILIQIGVLHLTLGEGVEAEQVFSEVLKISRSLRDERNEAASLHNLACILSDRGEIDQAQRLLGQSLEIAKKLGNQNIIARTLHELGRLAQIGRELEEARRFYSESLEIKNKLGDPFGVASTLHNLAVIAQLTDEMEESRRLYNESLEISKRYGVHSMVAMTLHQLGRLAENAGDKVEAARLYRESLSMQERLGSPNAEIARRSLMRVEGNQDVSD